MRRSLAPACALLLFAFTSVPHAQFGHRESRSLMLPRVENVDDARIYKLTQWLEAVDRHKAGEYDDAVRAIRMWTGDDLRSLQVDAVNLLMVMTNPRINRFLVKSDGSRQTEIGYSADQRHRLDILACAASGALNEPRCRAINADAAGEAFRNLSAHAAAARATGDPNYLIHRVALLHADIITLAARTVVPAAEPSALSIQFSDGTLAGYDASAEHLELVWRLLDRVIPPGSDKPAPTRDPLVYEWYVAMADWMEAHETHSTRHLNRARDLFPDDPEILFLSGAQHEAYAAPEIQQPVKQVRNPIGYKVAVEAQERELRTAEDFFRRAVAVRPTMAAAHLRLAHVLIEERRYGDAAAEAASAQRDLAEPQLRYYAALFLGTAEEGAGHPDAARSAYTAAAQLFPSAQSPLVALSELGWKQGDRDAALGALDRMFALSADQRRSDPWWAYYRSQVADPDARLDRFRDRFRTRPAS